MFDLLVTPVTMPYPVLLNRLCCCHTAFSTRATTAATLCRCLSATASAAEVGKRRQRDTKQPGRQPRWVIQRSFVHPTTASGATLTQSGQNALAHFDKLYGPEFGSDFWPSIRLALLSPPKHAAVLNRFYPDQEVAQSRLVNAGAEDLTECWRRDFPVVSAQSATTVKADEPPEKSSELKVLNYDQLKIRTSSAGGGADLGSRSNLDEFVPATEFITEMDPRGRASPVFRHGQESAPNSADAPCAADPADPDLWLPCDLGKLSPTLRVFVFPPAEDLSSARFPKPRPDRDSGLCPYLPLDLGSVAAAMALAPANGDSVLDLCSAPGAKAFCIMQCALPSRLLCVDNSSARSGRLARLLGSHMSQPVLAACSVSQLYANALDPGLFPPAAFDRVLVDPTCSGDRHSLNDPSANLFSGRRSRERVGLPAKQLELLIAGAEACSPGGSVVYSTCTMSPAQNEAVVLAALGDRLKDRFKLVDLRPLALLLNASCRVQVRPAGLLVLPYLLSNYGPTYICKLQRVG